MPKPFFLTPPAGVGQSEPIAKWLTLLRQVVNGIANTCAYDTFVPVTGFSHTIASGNGMCLLLPAGTLAAGTITLPAQSPDGFQQAIASPQTVTSLTVAANSGQTIVGTTVFALTAGSEVIFMWVAAAKTWYRIR